MFYRPFNKNPSQEQTRHLKMIDAEYDNLPEMIMTVPKSNKDLYSYKKEADSPLYNFQYRCVSKEVHEKHKNNFQMNTKTDLFFPKEEFTPGNVISSLITEVQDANRQSLETAEENYRLSVEIAKMKEREKAKQNELNFVIQEMQKMKQLMEKQTKKHEKETRNKEEALKEAEATISLLQSYLSSQSMINSLATNEKLPSTPLFTETGTQIIDWEEEEPKKKKSSIRDTFIQQRRFKPYNLLSRPDTV